jgi:hypothetical protein
MAKCRIDMTASEVADAINKQALSKIMSGKADSIEEVKTRLNFFDTKFEKKEVPLETVKSVSGKYLVKESSPGMANVYTVAGEPTGIIPETFTTEGSVKFEKKMGKTKAASISSAADSIIKKDSGTVVHKALEDMITTLAATEYSDRVQGREGVTPKSFEDIKKETGLNRDVLNELYKLAKELLDDAVATQKSIDPKQKPLIRTEQKLLANARLGGTADLIFVFSDLTASHFDFKTIVPKNEVLEKTIRGKKLIDYNWIPFYKYEDWNLQLPKTTSSLINVVGLKGIRKSRVIPIQLELKWDEKEKKLTDTIMFARSFASGDKYLSQIPIQEVAEKDVLQKSVDQLSRLKNNLEIDLQNTPSSDISRRNYIKARLERITISINKIIVDKDVRALLNDYNKVINKYMKLDDMGSFESLKDIKDPKSDAYLSLENILDMLKEVEIFKSVVDSTGEYYSALGLSKEESVKYEIFADRLSRNLSILGNKLQEEVVERLMLSPSTLKEIKNSADISTLSKIFDEFSAIRHPVFEEARQRIFEAKNQSRLDMQNFRAKLIEVTRKVEEWGKSNGFSGFSWYKALVDERTGNLYSKFNQAFTDERSKALENGDAKFMNKYYQLKPDADDILDKARQNYMLTYGLNPKDKDDAKKIALWNNKNTFENLLVNPRAWYIYYELKPEYQFGKASAENLKEVYSPQFINIQNTPALKEYYDFWTDNMKKFRSMIGFGKDYERVPDNFVPWMRADITTTLFQDGGFSATIDQIKQAFNITSDDMEFGDTLIQGKIDPATGEPLHEIPRFFVKPLFNKDNEIDKRLKSYDLSNSLFAFASMAFNYEGLKKIEPEIHALKEVLNQYGVVDTDAFGQLKKSRFGQVSKLIGAPSEVTEAFDKHIKYLLYGIKTQDKKINPKAYQLAKKANEAQVVAALAFKPITQLAAGIAARTNAYYEGVKGFYYTRAQASNANKLLIKAANKNSKEGNVILALINFFEPASKSDRHKAVGVGGNIITDLVKRDLPFIGFRKGSELVDNTIFLSMLQNYGIDANGNVKRIERLGQGSKSLLDLTLENSTKDKLVIPGIIDDAGKVNIKTYTQFRSMVRKVSKGIKGEMDGDDINAINMTVLGQILMTYKNWFPHLTKERFQGIKYDGVTDTATIGKYAAIWESELKPEHKGLLSLMTHVGVLSGRLALDLSTFGLLKNTAVGFKANEERARELLRKYKEKNPDSEVIQNLSEEEFIEYMQGQIRSSIVELRAWLTFAGVVLLMGLDWDDDDEPDWKKYYATRQLYRIVNRTKRELGFYYGSESLDLLLNKAIPLGGTLITLKKAISNSVDETVDLFGLEEEDNRDKTPFGYYTLRLLPYHGLITVFEPYEEDVKKEI